MESEGSLPPLQVPATCPLHALLLLLLLLLHCKLLLSGFTVTSIRQMV